MERKSPLAFFLFQTPIHCQQMIDAFEYLSFPSIHVTALYLCIVATLSFYDASNEHTINFLSLQQKHNTATLLTFLGT
jgi:hypothetical protein